MDEHRESDLIARVQQGDIDEFAHLVNAYQHEMFIYIKNLIGQGEVADVVQEAFLAAFRYIPRYDPSKARFRTWLYRIARNQAYNALKKRPKRPTEPLSELIDHKTPADLLYRKELFRQLDQALASLKFPFRSVFILAEMEGMSHAQIADIEGIRLGTVKSRLSRAKTILKAAMEPYGDRP